MPDRIDSVDEGRMPSPAAMAREPAIWSVRTQPDERCLTCGNQKMILTTYKSDAHPFRRVVWIIRLWPVGHILTIHLGGRHPTRLIGATGLGSLAVKLSQVFDGSEAERKSAVS